MDARPLLVLALLAPALVRADMMLKYASAARPDETTVIQVKGTEVLVGDQSSKMLFQDGKQQVTIIDHASRTYMVMDEQAAQHMEQQMGAAQQQMSAMMQQMEQQMQNMSEEQRAQIRQMMGNRMPSGAARQPAKTTVQQQGEDTVAGVTCTRFMVLVNDKPSGDVCAARAGVLGLQTKDYNTLVSATETVRKLMERISGQHNTGTVTMNLRAMKGIPVRMRDLVDGDVSTLVARSSAELNAADFRVPSGYRKRDMMQ